MKKKAPLRILIVEDEPSDVILAERSLNKAGVVFQSQTVETKETLLVALEQFEPDLVISDYSMPQFDGMSALQTVLEHDAHLPFIVFTGSINEETAVECIKAGATDYVIKEHITRLPLAVRNAIQKKEVLLNTLEAQKRLLENEEKFRTLFEEAPDGVALLDDKGIIIDCNQAYCRMILYKREELIGQHIKNTLKNEYHAVFLEKFPILKKEGFVQVESEIIRKDGSSFNILRTGNALYDKKEIFKGAIIHTHDITTLKRSEEMIKHLNQVLRTIRNINKVISKEKNSDQMIQKVCDELTNTRGYSGAWLGLVNEKKELTSFGAAGYGNRFESFVKHLETKRIPQCALKSFESPEVSYLIKDKQKCSDCPLYDFEKGGKVLGVRLGKNGHFFGVLVTTLKEKNILSKDEIDLFQELAEDISLALHNLKTEKEKKEAGQALKEHEEKFVALYETATDGIIGIDPKGKITLWNRAAERMFGFKAREAQGKDMHALIAPGRFHEQAYTALKKFAHTGEGNIIGTTIEISGKRKDGTEFPLELSLSKFQQKGLWHAIAIIRDVTERKKKENELLEAKEKAQESDRLKSAFLANMSHEIRTPMNGIIGFVDLLRQQNQSPREQQEYLSMIQSSSEHLLSIINDLLNIARIEAGQVSITPHSFYLKKFLKEIYEIFKAHNELITKNISLSYNIPPNLPETIISDPIRIKQVLLNLLSNALKFTTKGEISFGAEEKQPGILTFYVADTGIGIDPSFHKKIFDRFLQVEGKLTREYGGTGLGLSISKGIVNKLGGEMNLNSEPEKGSTFSFTIPFTVPEKSEIENIPVEKKFKSFEGHTILIVEDVDSNFIILEKMMASTQIKIDRAINGREAVKLCREKDFSLVFMDIKLPLMDGYEATREIRNFLPELPIIAQTAYAMEDDREQALGAGCNDYITKPIQRKKLFEILDKYLTS